jgi:hypothetical protein
MARAPDAICAGDESASGAPLRDHARREHAAPHSQVSRFYTPVNWDLCMGIRAPLCGHDIPNAVLALL